MLVWSGLRRTPACLVLSDLLRHEKPRTANNPCISTRPVGYPKAARIQNNDYKGISWHTFLLMFGYLKGLMKGNASHEGWASSRDLSRVPRASASGEAKGGFCTSDHSVVLMQANDTHIDIRIHLLLYIYIYDTHVHVYIYVYTHVYIYTYIHMCIYIYIYTYVYTYMCILCKHTYTYGQTCIYV